MYNDLYKIIDENLTDGNVGARKNRSCRDNIFVMGAITNSVTNGNSPNIQVQVMDIKKCFDKLWLESCINELYNAGVQNDLLNMLYIENNNAEVAVKVNNNLSKRISVKNVIMQGSVWGSLKCTTLMDTLNKHMKTNPALLYKYKGDPNIEIGVLGMVDDTLGVTNCGEESIKKNSVINSFVETQKLELHSDKSVVVHVGNVNKCSNMCPELKVHKEKMHDVESTKYLGNCVTTRGGVRATIEDRRNKGWGKVSQVMAILGEVALGRNRVEAGLILRQSILISSLLWSAEAWSCVTDKELKKLEQVDSHFLKLLLDGHSKCPTVFHHLETGTLKLRHILMINRLMYHHHIVNLNDEETVKKVYNKQKEEAVKGDWIKLIENDFLFIGKEMDEDNMKETSKSVYKKWIKTEVKRAAFKSYLKERDMLSKIKEVEYREFKIQDYLTDKMFNRSERKLLYALRSRCYNAKQNFKSLYKNNMSCRFGCQVNESQEHSLTQCTPVSADSGNFSDIFETVTKQKQAIKQFSKIDQEREHKLKHLPGDGEAGTPASTLAMQQTCL